MPARDRFRAAECRYRGAAGRTSCAGFAFFAFGSVFARRSFFAFFARRSFFAVCAGRSFFAFFAFFARRSFFAFGAFFARGSFFAFFTFGGRCGIAPELPCRRDLYETPREICRVYPGHKSLGLFAFGADPGGACLGGDTCA